MEMPESSVSHITLRYNTRELTYDQRQVCSLHEGGVWSVVVSFPAPVVVTEYAFSTAEKNPSTDPIRWQLLGSNDEQDPRSWQLLDERQQDFATPLARFAPVYAKVG